jgi:muramoyltetrapeptide carboxypeptidase
MRAPLKPPALRSGDAIRILSLASPVEEARVEAGCAELARLGYQPNVEREQVFARDGFFAGRAASRVAALRAALSDSAMRAVFCTRGGYGTNYLLEEFAAAGGALDAFTPKILLGYSDITSLQVFLWQKFGRVSFYGPMVAHGFGGGADVADGYDSESFRRAVTETKQGWRIDLCGEALAEGQTEGETEGVVLGGCLTLIQTTLATPWELDTRDTILLLEDCDMKPYQVDRALMHLKQAGKFDDVRGIVLGDFPRCEGAAGGDTVKDVARRVLGELNAPIVFGAPIGHTKRAMLTVPLGVRGRLRAAASGTWLDLLEPAVLG